MFHGHDIPASPIDLLKNHIRSRHHEEKAPVVISQVRKLSGKKRHEFRVWQKSELLVADIRETAGHMGSRYDREYTVTLREKSALCQYRLI